MKKGIIISLILAISFICVTFVSAQTTQIMPRRTSSTVSTTIANKCQLLVAKVDTQIAKFNNNKDRHSKIFTALTDKIAVIIASLDAKGIDTGNLKADSITMSEKINKFNVDYQTYIDKLTETKSFACGASSGQFMSKFNEVKKQLIVIRKDISDIKNFYQTTVRPDIKAIRDQIKSTRTTTTPKLKLNIKGSSTSVVE